MTALAPSTPRAAATLIPERRKLLPAAFVCVLLGISERRAVSFMEDGTLYPAFNLSVRRDGRRLIYCWRESLLRAHAGLPKPAASADDAIAAILPILGKMTAESATIGGTELAYRWSCGRDRVRALVNAKELREVGRRPGPKASPRIAYASAVAFLHRRIIS